MEGRRVVLWMIVVLGMWYMDGAFIVCDRYVVVVCGTSSCAWSTVDAWTIDTNCKC